MLLYQQIEFILLHLDFVAAHFDELSPITRRMYATGMANELHQLVSQLSIINDQMDSSLSIEDAYLAVPSTEHRTFANSKMFEERYFCWEDENDSAINQLVDIFPMHNDDYPFTPENADKLKTGMRYLCSDTNISPRCLVYALSHSISSFFKLMYSIDHKKHNIQDYQWEDFWYTFLYRDDDLYSEQAINDYDLWKEEHDYQDIQVLKDKRTQEILELLKSGIFKYDTVPTNREVSNSIIKITDDALEDGMEIPENIQVECARFSKYAFFKEDILCLDYKKLGRYIYKHYREITEEQGNCLIRFDYMLLHIHDDMAKCNPKLKPYLRFYEDDMLEEVLNRMLKVIETCNILLKEDVPQDFLFEYLKAAFYGDNKNEVQAKLKGQSKYKLVCRMLGMIKTTQKVFKVETTTADIAKALATIVDKPKAKSLQRYIDEGASDYNSKLSKWSKEYVVNKLGNDADRLFMKIAND